MTSTWLVWAISAAATAGVIGRPWSLPEAIWPVAGAAILVAIGALPAGVALRGIARGTDVYLFLTGMMLLAELAREAGLFDWLAARAATLARGSAERLFALIYLVGTVVTIALSNDATAVVLTPAVAAVARAARVQEPLPYLLICAFVANAASFVLPISNPANLVIYGAHMPPLLQWLPRYALPSLVSIVATFVVLWLTQRPALRQPIAKAIEVPTLSAGGRIAGLGICATAVLLLGASALDWRLGLPTCIAGVATSCGVLLRTRSAPWPVLRGVSWAVLPLVAGLFVLVEALDRTGLVATLAATLHDAAQASAAATSWGAGLSLAIACNLINNLPAGLVAGTAVQQAGVPPEITGAVLIGVDLGPNLSVTGSLATILWLTALRRDGQIVGFWQFLGLGALVMPAALIPALAVLVLR